MDPKDIVRTGFDLVSLAYRGDDPNAADARYGQWVDELATLIPAGSRVLDLGCGCGLPATLLLSARYETVGVDFSPVQIERARSLVPAAAFLCADMTRVDLSPASFSAVVSFYALIHVPLDEQRPLFGRVRSWIVPGGYFMAVVGHGAWTGTESDWLVVKGADMYWSHTDEATCRSWLEEAGFRIVYSRYVPEDDVGHSLVLAQVPPAAPDDASTV